MPIGAQSEQLHPPTKGSSALLAASMEVDGEPVHSPRFPNVAGELAAREEEVRRLAAETDALRRDALGPSDSEGDEVIVRRKPFESNPAINHSG